METKFTNAEFSTIYYSYYQSLTHFNNCYYKILHIIQYYDYKELKRAVRNNVNTWEANASLTESADI